MKYLVALSLTIMLSPLALALAADQDGHDEYSLELKGYSQEMIYPTEVQISRMEGRFPPAPPSKGKQMWANFVNGDWTGTNQPFPMDTISPPHYQPK